jgi:FkbM family methyltransferase
VRSASKLVRNLYAISNVSGTDTLLAYARAILTNLPEILRTGNLLAADRAMSHRSWHYALQGVNFKLDGRHFSGAREMYCRQVYFPTPEFALYSGKWVIDLGANAGLFSLLAALAGCSVLAIEAQSGFIREIEVLADTQGVRDRIMLEQVLIGGSSGALSDVHALQSASHYSGVMPRQATMDELLAKHGVDEVDFLKVDIEGSEFDLFRSSATWLGKVRRIAMEVHPDHGNAKDLVSCIKSQDFRVELRDNDLVPVDSIPASGGYAFATRGEGRQAFRGR